ncbi:hypothetical protein BDV23DRAFT_150358 [Aspergillus alliaceus]|uniref:Uncharacterized protein n=1 Tax=Petromyces alliaceus TaxID=209559 RepID=A0A5N7CGW8_PETAA|nr:hypothetical protein BDV23DRAFT_150358 [Aspergillus alliaceus]
MESQLMSGEPWERRLLEGLQLFYREANKYPSVPYGIDPYFYAKVGENIPFLGVSRPFDGDTQAHWT